LRIRIFIEPFAPILAEISRAGRPGTKNSEAGYSTAMREMPAEEKAQQENPDENAILHIFNKTKCVNLVSNVATSCFEQAY
jgi:hypothetical protein